MGFRFSKRIKIAPGVSLNLSKSGISTSLGPRGAKVTLGHGKRRTTVGLPGSGLSHTTTEPNTAIGTIITVIIAAAFLIFWLF